MTESRIPNPESRPCAGLTAPHAIVAAYLERCCRGRASARTKDRIVGELKAVGLNLEAGAGNREQGTGNRESGTRKLERLMHDLAEAGQDVGSSDEGYFWCMDEEDYDLAYHYLVTRMAPMRRRAEANRRRRAARFPGDGVLFDAYGGQAYTGTADERKTTTGTADGRKTTSGTADERR